MNRRDVLEQVKCGRLTPEEAVRLLKEGRGHPWQALIIDGPGTIEAIRTVPVLPRDPNRGEVQIEVRAFSLNFGDLLCVKGLYPAMPPYPFTPGFEVAGIVRRVGEGVHRVRGGDAVVALMGEELGGHSTVVTVDQGQVVKKPEGVSFEEACAFPAAFLTAEYALAKAELSPGERILIQAAAGGVGLMAIQLAHQRGAEVLATAGSEGKLRFLRAMGVRYAFNYLESDFAAEIRRATGGRGVDVVLNTLAGDAIQKGLDLLAPGGRYLELAMTGLRSARNISLTHLTDNQSLVSIDLRRLLLRDRVRGSQLLERMAQALAEGNVRPTVGRVFTLSELRSAYGHLEARESIGRIVVTVPLEGSLRAPASGAADVPAAVGPVQDGGPKPVPADERSRKGGDVAVIGMSGRFPGAENVREFWSNLASGRCSIGGLPETRWGPVEEGGSSQNGRVAPINRFGGFLSDVDRFDCTFFKMSGKEAELCDPQQRLFLEECWKALEDAGYATIPGAEARCGVFAGAGASDYRQSLERAGLELAPSSFWGNDSSVLPSRIAYFLDLKGPAIAVNTACSSSLVAIHLACQSIRSGECRMALAGGVFICSTPGFQRLTGNAGMLSADGVCRAFDDEANGFVPGEGVGVVVLKDLAEALRDRDHVYGVIKGSAVNQDGRTNGITAPCSLSQTAVELAAFEAAGIRPETLTYVEAHGTGTRLGDPIEIEALTRAFAASTDTDRRQFCAIGSVKTNIGHAAMAAGIASVIKVLLALQHRQLPPSLNFRSANRHIDFANSPFFVNTALRSWQSPGVHPRRAGISSFGFSGTNCHLVVEEAPLPGDDRPDPSQRAYPIVLSAKSESVLRDWILRVREWLKEAGPEVNLADLSYTLTVRRHHFERRLFLMARDIPSLDRALERLSAAPAVGLEVDSGTGSASAAQQGADWCRALLETLGQARNAGLEGEAQAWDELGTWYVRGVSPDWSLLFPPGIGRCLTLPGYPLEPLRFWPQSANAGGHVSGTPESAVPPALASDAGLHPAQPAVGTPVFLVKGWETAPRPASLSPSTGQTVIFLTSDETCALAERLFSPLDGLRRVLLQAGSGLERLSEGRHVYCPYQPEEGVQAAAEIFAGDPCATWVIDLSDLREEATDACRWRPGKVTFVQEWIKRWGAAPMVLIHVTAGLQPFRADRPNLSGADFIGIVRTLDAEYARMKAVNVDLPEFPRETQALEAILAGEAGATDTAGEVCYRGGGRYLPVMREVPPSEMRISLPPPEGGRVYVVTGGTRGLGAVVAAHLAERGARNLAILGHTPLPERSQWPMIGSGKNGSTDAERVAGLLALEARGANVRVYTGALTDAGRLKDFFAMVRSQLGPIGGVVHCAGTTANERPAFIHKRFEDFKRVLEPKMEGLQTLAGVLGDEDLQFFLLFSSISAVVPRLGVGAADYVTANAFMDAFAAFQAHLGRTYYRSIGWTIWEDAGMRPIVTDMYKKFGFLTHRPSQGLRLMDEILGLERTPCVAAGLIDRTVFNAQHLVRPQAQDTVTGLERSGKRAQADAQQDAEAGAGEEAQRIKTWLRGVLARELKLEPALLGDSVTFGELGVDSVLLGELMRSLERELGVSLHPSMLLENPTVARLAAFLDASFPENVRGRCGAAGPVSTAKSGEDKEMRRPVATLHQSAERGDAGGLEPVAVIGMACHFPGAPDVGRYWENLAAGLSSIGEVPASRWSVEQLYSLQYEDGKSISRWGGFLDGIEAFDPAFFGLPERFAAHVDPLMRQVLEVSADLLHDAGYRVEEVSQRAVGTFFGARVGTYGARIARYQKESVVGIGQNFIAAHLSQWLDITGPSFVVDSACSSSLLSVHLACQSLRSGESELAIAGGVDLLLDETTYVMLSKARALSPDGKCYTFDERANGFVPGEGCGAILLKPLERARRDGDRIYAVIEASAMNNDGRTMGITTPNRAAQRAVIQKAYQSGDIDAGTVGYIEAHGTGTLIGDPIELQALTDVFRERTAEREYCGVGSVKTNVGHLLSAAGIASLIKVVLALHHRQIPPTLNCETPNPRFKFTESPFYPVTRLIDWPARGGTRRAGVSSFGFGGTNLHMILAEWIDPDRSSAGVGRRPLPPVAFRKTRHWLERNTGGGGRQESGDNLLLELRKAK